MTPFWSLQCAVSTLPTIDTSSQLRRYEPGGMSLLNCAPASTTLRPAIAAIAISNRIFMGRSLCRSRGTLATDTSHATRLVAGGQEDGPSPGRLPQDGTRTNGH